MVPFFFAMKSNVAIRRRPFQARAFTLIEVLIVLAIVGMLAAILLPVFARVRDAAHTATCQSNLHQIGLALQLYANDYNRYYPNVNSAPPHCTWTENMTRYVRSMDIFNCPTDTTEFYKEGCPPDEIIGDKTYHYDGAYIFNRPNWRAPIHNKLGETFINSPSTLFLILDGQIIDGFVHVEDRPLTTQELKEMGVLRRHRDGSNVLFADGHVKWCDMSLLTQRKHWTLAGEDK